MVHRGLRGVAHHSTPPQKKALSVRYASSEITKQTLTDHLFIMSTKNLINSESKKSKAVSVRIQYPEWCWTKGGKSGRRRWINNRYTKVCDQGRWSVIEGLTSYLQGKGINYMSSSGGCSDYTCSSDLEDQFIYHCIAYGIGASQDSNGTFAYPNWDFNLVAVNTGNEQDLMLPPYGPLYEDMKTLDQLIATDSGQKSNS